jgi:hypothetical protein
MGRLTRDGKRVPLVGVSGRWFEAFGFKEGAKYTAIGVENGFLVLTVYEAAPPGGTSRPETSLLPPVQDDVLPPRNRFSRTARAPLRTLLTRRISHPRPSSMFEERNAPSCVHRRNTGSVARRTIASIVGLDLVTI